MTQEEKLNYGKLVLELCREEKEACKQNDFKKQTELLDKLIKLKLINPEYFMQTIRLFNQ